MPLAKQQQLIARGAILESPSIVVPVTVILELEWVRRARRLKLAPEVTLPT